MDLNKIGNSIAYVWNKTTSECGKAIDTCPLNPWGHDPNRTPKPDNGVGQSMKANLRHDPELAQPIYPSSQGSKQKPNRHAQLDNVHDSVAFSPEALAMMA